jgi:hypothetical protein
MDKTATREEEEETEDEQASDESDLDTSLVSERVGQVCRRKVLMDRG